MKEQFDLAKFENDRVIALHIADQNDRYNLALVDEAFEGPDLKQFQQVAIDGIAAEQAQTVDILRGRDFSDYETLVRLDIQNELSLRNAKERLDNEPNVDKELKARLFHAAERAVELSPLSKETVNDLLDERVQQLPENPSKHELVNHIVQLEVVRSQIADIFDVAGRAWPVPIVPRRLDEESKPTTQAIDVIPDTPPLGGNSVGLLGRSRERYGRNAGASELTALHLMENAGTSLLPGDIAEAIYNSDEKERISVAGRDADRYMNARVHRILSPIDSIVPGLLEDSGYKLQYGWRIFVDETGAQVGHKYRIFRAVEAPRDVQLPGAYVETVTTTGDAVDSIDQVAQPEQAASQELSLDDRRMIVIEQKIQLLDQYGVINPGRDSMTVARMFGLLHKLKSDEPQLFGQHGALENFRSVISAAPRYEKVTIVRAVICTIGNTFGRDLPHRTVATIERQVQAAVANYCNNELEEAA